MEHRRSNRNPALDVVNIGPRVKMALRLWLSGTVRSKKEAAQIVGVHPAYLGPVSKSPGGQAFIRDQEAKIDEKSLDTNVLLQRLSREAVLETAAIMRAGQSEANRLRAAIDLADRGPETSKIQKHQVEAITLSSKDAKELAAAMVAAAQLKQKFAEATEGNYDKTKYIPPPSETDGKDS